MILPTFLILLLVSFYFLLTYRLDLLSFLKGEKNNINKEKVLGLTRNSGVISLSTTEVMLISPVRGLMVNTPYGGRSIPAPEIRYVILWLTSQSDLIYKTNGCEWVVI